LKYTESTYGNSMPRFAVRNKIDLGFALNPTPQRALDGGFLRRVFIIHWRHAEEGAGAKTWADISKPVGQHRGRRPLAMRPSPRRFAPNANIKSLKSRDR